MQRYFIKNINSIKASIFTRVKNEHYYVLGVMSGTSLDGIDVATCHFYKTSEGWKYTIENATTFPYPTNWKNRLQEGILLQPNDLQTLDQDYTQYLGTVIFDYIKERKISNLTAICSHGHTILHQPKKGVTLQIGNLPEIANCTQQKVVCNFRVQDVLLGGQGAPLVPIGDKLLFSSYDYCLNLGGFANVSFQQDKARIAYDICPVNIVLNTYAEKLGTSYDRNGQWASEGIVNTELLNQLNGILFYQKPPPKSLGLEWVHQNIFPILTHSKLSEKDILATFVEHIAVQIASSFKPNSNVLITGGGAYNGYLVERLQFYSKSNIVIPDALVVEYKEALIFALLGVLRLRNEINCLSSVTGASRDHSSGLIFG